MNRQAPGPAEPIVEDDLVDARRPVDRRLGLVEQSQRAGRDLS